jgi:regulator of protease activity HflC (stomatin/prohibitin superfamily)
MNQKNQAILSVVLIIVVLGLFMWGIPKYKVYSRELNGKAQLKEAEWSRKIAVQEAEAEKDSASLKAEAEVIRAKGIAEANRIIAGSITEGYLKYRFIEGLNDGNSEVIYVPTEANLPVLEAVRKLN